MSLRATPKAGRSNLLMSSKSYCVYILTNVSNTVLYTGITGYLAARVYQHKHKSVDGFTKKYNLNKLVYYEIFEWAIDAINREKQIKGGSRKKKLDLIRIMNPRFEDLYTSIG